MLCEDLEGHSKTGNMRKLFGAVRSLSKKFTAPLAVINDKNGELLTEKDQVLARWKEYCADLYTDDEDQTPIPFTESEPPPLKSEVAWAMGKTAKNKSPGSDGVPVELFKEAGEPAIDMMHKLCTHVWNTGKWPMEWMESVFITIPKKVIAKNAQITGQLH